MDKKNFSHRMGGVTHWPSMHTTGFSVALVNPCAKGTFLKRKRKNFSAFGKTVDMETGPEFLCLSAHCFGLMAHNFTMFIHSHGSH